MSRARSKLVSVSALWVASVACAKLVGITDTPVTREDAPDASLPSLGGSGGAPTVATTSPAGSGGGGGGSGPALSSTGNGGSAGAAPVSPPDGGLADAAPLTCSEAATRCGPAGREVCGSGVWQPQACPLNTPTCEGEGQCVVRGPTMISVGGSFFIDATEVTVAQYGLFLAAKGSDVSGQREVCSWNQSYYEGPGVMNPSEYPMTSIDWCDAAAYCAWAGKHLCGRIGGGPIAFADIFVAEQSQWFVACGGGGFHPNDNPVCNSSDGFRDIAPVATYPGCEGYFPGIFDMEGNVREWIDACDGNTGASDVCYVLGGSTLDAKSYCDEVGVDAQDPWLRSTTTGYDGFRCCAG